MIKQRRSIIVKRLRDLQNFWSKDPSPLTPVPEWLKGDDFNVWSKELEQLVRDAADLIVDLTVEVDSLKCMLENAMSGNDM